MQYKTAMVYGGAVQRTEVVYGGPEEFLFDGTEVGTEEELADADGTEGESLAEVKRILFEEEEEYLAEVKRVEEEENGAVQPVVMICEYY